MRKRIYHRWFAVLGILAMFGAFVAIPMTSAHALPMSTQAAQADVSHSGKLTGMTTADEMPCHKSAQQQKPCPDCPKKTCPEMGSCLVKCFQQLVPPLAGGMHLAPAIASRLLPMANVVVASTLVPPLLRPPSV